MPCGGLDIHSPYLFLTGAGLFLGAALSAAVRSFLYTGKRRARSCAGVYFYLTLAFTVVLLSIFVLDIPGLTYNDNYLYVASIAAVIAAVSATWKRSIGAVLLVFLLALYALLTLLLQDSICESMQEPLTEVRVLSVEENRLELELIGREGPMYGVKKIRTDGEVRGFSLVYKRIEFAEWMFFPRNRYFYRLISLCPLLGEGDIEAQNKNNGMRIVEQIGAKFPFIQIEQVEVDISDPSKFSKYRVFIEEERLELEKNTW